MSVIKIAVNGALGRMGLRILAVAHDQPNEFKVVQAFDVDKQAGKFVNSIKLSSLHEPLVCDVLIDFSGPEGTRACLDAAVSAKTPLIIGSTGLSDDLVKKIDSAALKIPVVVSANMSVGINLVLELLSLIAAKLPKDFDIEITEAHHRHKKDAPSGTALMLADAIAEAKKWNLKKVLKYRAEGKSGEERPSDEIGMQVIRAGEIVGDHTVFFSGPSETIEITHRAQSRDTFVRGALLAARFAASAKPGKYSMSDVLKK